MYKSQGSEDDCLVMYVFISLDQANDWKSYYYNPIVANELNDNIGIKKNGQPRYPLGSPDDGDKAISGQKTGDTIVYVQILPVDEKTLNKVKDEIDKVGMSSGLKLTESKSYNYNSMDKGVASTSLREVAFDKMFTGASRGDVKITTHSVWTSNDISTTGNEAPSTFFVDSYDDIIVPFAGVEAMGSSINDQELDIACCITNICTNSPNFSCVYSIFYYL